jgi:Trypsin
MVVLAKHCVVDPPMVVERTIVTIGFDGNDPKIRSVKVRGVAKESTVADGGVLGLGVDVAVLHLAEPVTDVATFPYAPFDPGTVGQDYTQVGYGIQDNDKKAGFRNGGTVRLDGVTGTPLHIIFHTVEQFLRHAPELPDFAGLNEAELRDAFDHDVTLLAGHEAVFGNGPGNAQQCFGDSGGPFLQDRHGQPTVIGVASAGLAGTDEICKFGGIASVFGPKAIAFLDHEAACPLLPAGGACDGSVAVTCGGSGRKLKLVRTDCAAKGKVCALDGAGAARCIKK